MTVFDRPFPLGHGCQLAYYYLDGFMPNGTVRKGRIQPPAHLARRLVASLPEFPYLVTLPLCSGSYQVNLHRKRYNV